MKRGRRILSYLSAITKLWVRGRIYRIPKIGNVCGLLGYRSTMTLFEIHSGVSEIVASYLFSLFFHFFRSFFAANYRAGAPIYDKHIMMPVDTKFLSTLSNLVSQLIDDGKLRHPVRDL
jgi:hypothetical protein